MSQLSVERAGGVYVIESYHENIYAGLCKKTHCCIVWLRVVNLDCS